MPASPAPTVDAESVLAELRPLAEPGYKKILLNHGVREPVLGVKIEHLKKLQKRLKTNHALALDLYATGVYDAMYLAGLIADDARMTKADLRRWLKTANSPSLCAYTVPWVAAGSPHGHDLALEWIDSKHPHTAVAGWNTLAGLVGTKPDADLDLDELRQLLRRVETTIETQPDPVPYAMNSFLIAVGCHVAPLTDAALGVAKAIGKVTVDMGDTACKVPDATTYINKVKQRNALGNKRKSCKC